MSKGLEALENIREQLNGVIYYEILRNNDITTKYNIKGKEDICKFIDNVVGANDIEKELKALEIIKKKKVNIFAFYKCCGWHNPSNYNDSIGCPVNCEITQEEYNLLKEVLL